MPKKEPTEITSARITSKGQIVIAIITLIGVLVTAYWQFVLKPGKQDQATRKEYVGRVLDANALQPIQGAKITLDLEGSPQIAYTDSEGTYRFELAINSQINGQIRVDAQTYQLYTRNITISPQIKVIEDIRLTPLEAVSTSTSALIDRPSLTPTFHPSETPAPVFSEAIIVVKNFFDGINSAGNKDDLVRAWNLETSGNNGFQCREAAGCVLSNFQNKWWESKVQYKLFDCGANLVDIELRYYKRDPILATTPTAPAYFRYQLIDQNGQLKINASKSIEGPGADCKLATSIP